MAPRGRYRDNIKPVLAALTAFALAFGHANAVCIAYLRHLLEVPRGAATLGLGMFDPAPEWLVPAEQGREAALVLACLALALLAGRSGLSRLGAFLYALGGGVLAYYLGMLVLLSWPPTLGASDLLTVIPRPYFAPVWAILAGAAAAIAAGVGLMSVAGRSRR